MVDTKVIIVSFSFTPKIKILHGVFGQINTIFLMILSDGTHNTRLVVRDD